MNSFFLAWLFSPSQRSLCVRLKGIYYSCISCNHKSIWKNSSGRILYFKGDEEKINRECFEAIDFMEWNGVESKEAPKPLRKKLGKLFLNNKKFFIKKRLQKYRRNWKTRKTENRLTSWLDVESPPDTQRIERIKKVHKRFFIFWWW